MSSLCIIKTDHKHLATCSPGYVQGLRFGVGCGLPICGVISSRAIQCHPGNISEGHPKPLKHQTQRFLPGFSRWQTFPTPACLASWLKRYNEKMVTPNSWFKRQQWGGSRREETCQGAHKRSRRKRHYLQILKPTKVPPLFFCLEDRFREEAPSNSSRRTLPVATWIRAACNHGTG